MSWVDVQVNRQAAMIAYIDNYYLMMWLSFIAVPLVLVIRRPPPPQR
jgi:MFS transporter, DHA2 family, multidrug resistance protein